MKEPNIIELDERSDFVFLINTGINLEKGFKIIEHNFDEIFDMYEKYETRAITNLQKIDGFSSIADNDGFIQMIKDDRSLQKRLTTSFIERGIGEFTYDDIVKTISEVEREKKLTLLVGQDQLITYDPARKKSALGDLLDIVGYKYSKTVPRGHLIKGQPEEFIGE